MSLSPLKPLPSAWFKGAYGISITCSAKPSAICWEQRDDPLRMPLSWGEPVMKICSLNKPRVLLVVLPRVAEARVCSWMRREIHQAKIAFAMCAVCPSFQTSLDCQCLWVKFDFLLFSVPFWQLTWAYRPSGYRTSWSKVMFTDHYLSTKR